MVLVIVGMTVVGLVLLGVCGLVLYHRPLMFGGLTIDLLLWLGALYLGGFLLGPAASLLGGWFADRAK